MVAENKKTKVVECVCQFNNGQSDNSAIEYIYNNFIKHSVTCLGPSDHFQAWMYIIQKTSGMFKIQFLV
jgi:hypothetical protein